jgi:hypothetical protein
MITRSLHYEELKDFTWKVYPMQIIANTTKEDIINFTNKLLIKTNELHFDKYFAYIDTVDTEIMIITKDNKKVMGSYNHIYKGNHIQVKFDGKLYTWSKAKNKIKTIVFMDSLHYHESVRHLWSENGFSFTKFYNEGYKDNIINSLLNNELIQVA